jgi:hypothetical protein
MDPYLVMAFALRLIAMALFLAGAAILARAWVASSLQGALAFSVLAKQRRIGLATALLFLFVCLGTAVGLSAYQDLAPVAFDTAQLVGGTLLLAASVATFELAWLGFGALPSPGEAQLITDAPESYVASIGAADRELQP